ncbi:MAG: hypothetical protein IIW55_04745 [Bacteroidales bacterium]|nr:hypothetical protein [Bacteroidales bacterium]
MKKILFISLIVSLLFSCSDDDSFTESRKNFKYPESKVWKHGVYSKWEAQELEGLFDGLEVDVIYSPEKNDIYVGRVVADTSKNLPLDEWLAMLKEPDKMAYWVDFKNLNANNAENALSVFDNLVDKYNIKDKFFIESRDIKALKVAKSKDYHVMLWVENLHYWKNPSLKDTISVMNMIRSQINDLQPSAISCEYTMFPLLCDTFPEQNIHFWHTPKEYTPENVEYTKKLCENPSVKVVLVDYPTPDIF